MTRLTGFDDAALKEQFSVTYVRAVAYAAGAVVDELKVDRDSIDVVIRAKGQVGPKRSPSVDAQLKCHTGKLNAQGELVYDLPIKNHRDLIPSNPLVPRILIVVAVPDDVADPRRVDARAARATPVRVLEVPRWTTAGSQRHEGPSEADRAILARRTREHLP